MLIAVAAALVNNVVLSQFLGLCPFLGVSKKTDTAAAPPSKSTGCRTISPRNSTIQTVF